MTLSPCRLIGEMRFENDFGFFFLFWLFFPRLERNFLNELLQEMRSRRCSHLHNLQFATLGSFLASVKSEEVSQNKRQRTKRSSFTTKSQLAN
jgi:hypothetical protein